MESLMEVMKSWDGFVSSGSGGNRRYSKSDLARTVGLIENHDGLAPHWHKAHLIEAMTQDTFPLMFADTINRRLVAGFTGVGTPLSSLFGPTRLVSDFNTIKIHANEGLTRRLQKVNEKGEYKAREEGESVDTHALSKYGNQVDFSWESWLRDDLGAFARFPGKLATSAINTEAFFQTSLFMAAAGPIAATFTGTGGQAAVAVTALSEANLETAIQAMGAYTSTGEPIQNRPMFLVVGPALELTAKRILFSSQWVPGRDDEVRQGNLNTVASMNIQLIVDKWLPIVNTTTPTTAWFLAAAPSDIQGVEWAKLSGKESPELWQKASDSIRVGGGSNSPFEGDFATDNIFYRVRHCFSGKAFEHRAFWASTGAGA